MKTKSKLLVKTIFDVRSRYHDEECHDEIVSKIDEHGKNGCVISIKSGGCIFVPKNPNVAPKVGDTATFYGKGFGYPVRGMAFNGIINHYRSPAQAEKDHKDWVRNYHNEQKAEFKKNKASMDKDYDELPDIFKNRIARFRAKDKDFRWESESYEMFCCKEAVKIANALKTQDAILEWAKKDWKEQIKTVNIDEGHSNNTFGGAVRLAQALVLGKDC